LILGIVVTGQALPAVQGLNLEFLLANQLEIKFIALRFMTTRRRTTMMDDDGVSGQEADGDDQPIVYPLN